MSARLEGIRVYAAYCGECGAEFKGVILSPWNNYYEWPAAVPADALRDPVACGVEGCNGRVLVTQTEKP